MAMFRFTPITGSMQKPRLHSEELEPRLTPVVGAFDDASLVATGGGYDGVARLESVETDGATTTSTGTLLNSGLYLLSAGHVLKATDGTVPSVVTNVTFTLNDGSEDRDIIIKVPKSRYLINPDYNGEPTNGNDVSLLPIPDQINAGANRFMIAPFGADRYGLFTGNNEVGQQFTTVGYGRAGTGESGSIPGTSGVKRIGYNRFDADAHLLATAPFNSSAPPTGKALAWDFDNGTTTNDAFGSLFNINNTGLGANESNPAQGDSGGPLFIGNKIAGIVSYSDGGVPPTDINQTIDRGFGEFGVATRVSAYTDFINQQTSAKRQLVLDMNYQLLGVDERSENLRIEAKKENGELVIRVTGSSNPKLNAEYYRGELASVSGLTLRGSADSEQFVVDSSLNIPVTILGRGGNNSISLLASSAKWNVTGVNGGTVLNGQIMFSQIANILGTSGQDVFRFGQNGRLTGSIDSPTGTNGDVLDYSATNSSVIVNLLTDSASRVGGDVTEVQHVIGSAIGGDRLIGASDGSLLITHGRGNILQSGGGNSILIGGLGANTLTGGSGNDLLIAGAISYENNLDAINQLFVNWQGNQTSTYSERVNLLKSGTASMPKLSRNSSVFLPNTKATGPRLGRNSVVNSTLTGNAGKDWFWTPATQQITDRQSGELVNQ